MGAGSEDKDRAKLNNKTTEMIRHRLSLPAKLVARASPDDRRGVTAWPRN